MNALRNGVDIVVACPGRLEDLIQQRHCDLDQVEITVLDEADHMADLGFLPAGQAPHGPHARQGPAHAVLGHARQGHRRPRKRYLTDPVTHSVDSEQSPVDAMAHHVLHVTTDDRLPVLVDLTSAPGRTIVFTRTKHRAKQLTRQLNAHGVPSVEMHGNLTQNVRVRNLAAFSEGRRSMLVATDIAARGIHVDDVTLVIHADPPVEHKAYLHRSGRTARAGNEGTVVTLMTEGQRRTSDLARKAGITPTITRVERSHPILRQLAEGTAETSGPGIAPRPPATDVVRTPRPGSATVSVGPSGRGPRTDDTRGPRPDRQPGAARRRGERPAGSSGNSARTPGNGGGNGPARPVRRAAVGRPNVRTVRHRPTVRRVRREIGRRLPAAQVRLARVPSRLRPARASRPGSGAGCTAPVRRRADRSDRGPRPQWRMRSFSITTTPRSEIVNCSRSEIEVVADPVAGRHDHVLVDHAAVEAWRPAPTVTPGNRIDSVTSASASMKTSGLSTDAFIEGARHDRALRHQAVGTRGLLAGAAVRQLRRRAAAAGGCTPATSGCRG